MEQTTAPVTPSGSSLAARWTPTIKLLVLGGLVLVLLIPVSHVLWLVRERQVRADQVRAEISAVWGREQTLGAAVLSLPVRIQEDGTSVERDLHLLPTEIHWRGELAPQLRNRGIFDVPVYEGRLRAEGWFGPQDLAAAGISPDSVLWERAVLTIGVGDLRGIQERLELQWAGRRHSFVPGSASPELMPEGLQAQVGSAALAAPDARLPFSFEILLRGTETLQFLPLGEVTTVRLASTWPDPGFGGAFLPRERSVRSDGFTASWNVPYFGRGYPQWWWEGSRAGAEIGRAAASSAFGVTLIRPADQYQRAERSVKYAVLFIVLTFTALFLLELLSAVRLHPVEYLLVGFALSLFYVLLLALSEHIGFLPAYSAAALATVGLISLYTRSLLRSWRKISVLAATLSGLYAYLYGLLVAQDHSLLLGATGLFSVLALVMYLTRNLDWWTLRFRGPGDARPPRTPLSGSGGRGEEASPG
jgi:inner membrane protein